MPDNFRKLKYRSGCYYIEQLIDYGTFDEDKYPFYCQSRISNYLSNSPVGEDEESTQECIDLWHEINHLVQDLSNFACIVESELYDLIAGATRYLLSNGSGLKFPLFEASNIEYNNRLSLDEEIKKEIASLEKIIQIYNYLFVEKHRKPDTKEYHFNSPNEDDFFERFSLSFNHLIECHAQLKSYWDVFYRAKDKKECDLLHKLVHNNNIFPINFENGKFNFNIQELKLNQDYLLVNYIIIIFVALYGPNYEELFDYYKNKIPHQIHKSEAERIYNITKLVLEVSLNIPSFDFIYHAVEKGQYHVDDFCPPLRFYRIIKTIRDNDFPPAKEDEDFYITFHNWVAEFLGWPNYDDTYHSIDTSLLIRYSRSKENLVAEQLKCIEFKKNNYKLFLSMPGYQVLQKLNFNLLFCNGQGLEIVDFIGRNHIYNPGFTNFYQEWFRAGLNNKRLHVNESDPDNVKIEKTIINNRSAIRERLCRIFSRAFTEAYLYNGYFDCPLSKLSCPYHTPYCESFKSFDNMSTFCKMIVLRLPRGNYMCNEGEGNCPDCMFLNYILDMNC